MRTLRFDKTAEQFWTAQPPRRGEPPYPAANQSRPGPLPDETEISPAQLRPQSFKNQRSRDTCDLAFHKVPIAPLGCFQPGAFNLSRLAGETARDLRFVYPHSYMCNFPYGYAGFHRRTYAARPPRNACIRPAVDRGSLPHEQNSLLLCKATRCHTINFPYSSDSEGTGKPSVSWGRKVSGLALQLHCRKTS